MEQLQSFCKFLDRGGTGTHSGETVLPLIVAACVENRGRGARWLYEEQAYRQKCLFGDHLDKRQSLMGLLDMQKTIDDGIQMAEEWRTKAPPTVRYLHLYQLEYYGARQGMAVHQEALGQDTQPLEEEEPVGSLE